MMSYIEIPIDGWHEFTMSMYQSHNEGQGYATPEVCISAAYAFAKIVQLEYRRWYDFRKPTRSLNDNWVGNGLTILMHDGSTTTLGTMLRLFLPDAEVKRYEKRSPVPLDSKPPYKSHFLVLCEDGIMSGTSLCHMREKIDRPIDLVLTISGCNLGTITDNILACNNQTHESLAVIQYHLNRQRNVWDIFDEHHGIARTEMTV